MQLVCSDTSYDIRVPVSINNTNLYHIQYNVPISNATDLRCARIDYALLQRRVMYHIHHISTTHTGQMFHFRQWCSECTWPRGQMLLAKYTRRISTRVVGIYESRELYTFALGAPLMFYAIDLQLFEPNIYQMFMLRQRIKTTKTAKLNIYSNDILG